MDNNEADIFANTLKKSKVQKPVALYYENERNYQKNFKEYSVQSALVNVSKQIKSFQSADSIMKGTSSRRNLDTFKTKDFLPLTMMSTEKQTEQISSNKFETQCVLDTQLINIIENAEALIDVPNNMNQEFDNTFNNIDMSNRRNVELDKEINSINSNDKEILEITNNTTIITNECYENVNSEVNKLSEGKSNFKDFEAERIKEEEMCYLDHYDDINTAPKSPILNSSPKKPLVFKLDTFENFEKIALSVIRDNPDFESAKILINSQIMNNELFIQSHAEPVLCDRDKSISPILNINKLQTKDEKKKIDHKYLVVEDNILFSDDDDEFKNDFQNLPLTCALETSFYNQSDVLDKTMYVGFQTASNKSIQVHTDTYSKAKSILDNIKTPEEYISLTKLVEVIDKTSKLNDNTTECNKERNKTKYENEDNFRQNDVDFETEFERDINIPEAVTKSKRNFEDVLKCDDENISMDTFENNDIDICNNKKLKISEEALRNPVKDTEYNTQINLTKNLRNNVKDEITPLNDHFKMDEHIMKEFECNFIVEDNCSGNSMKTDKSFDDKVNDNFRPNNDVNKVISDRAFMGFRTANNEEIKICEKALAETKNIFEDINLDNLEETANNVNKDVQNYNAYADQPSTSKNFIGFRTANNKDIKVSELALAKTKNIFDDINLDNLEDTANNFNKDIQNYNAYADQPSTSRSFIGFRTANNKDIKVSELALAKTKNIFEDINLDNLEEAANNFNKDVQNYNAYADQPSTSKSFIGFRTANNKDIKVSELALAKTKNIFEDINLHNLEEAANNFNKDVQNYNAYADQPSTSKSFVGFRTANNKEIKVSESALAKTKNIFDNIDSEMPIDETAIDKSNTNINKNNTRKINNEGDFVNPFPLSRSANNIPLKTTKITTNESISKVLNHDHKKPVPTIIGFQTASNKRVDISKEALAKTKNIFKEIMSKQIEEKACKKDENCMKDPTLLNEFKITESKQTIVRSTESVSHNHTDNKITFKNIGFKTASNKPVKISNEALETSKNIFQDLVLDDQAKVGIDSNKNMTPDALMQGFKTASDKPVSISDEALAKTKSIFQDIDTLYSNNDYKDINNFTDKINNSLQGFKTASNKPVTITEEALVKSKEMFKEFKVCEEISEPDLVKDSNKFVFEGFKTATNKSVKISEDALARSKKVFQDLDFEIGDNKVDEKEKNKFFGFQTARNKTVSVSSEALLKSKQIFEDIDLNCNFDDNKDKVDTNTVKNTFGFKTASNKNVNISEASLKNAKKIFDDVTTTNIIQNDVEDETTNRDCNIEELMNTEVIKNLEESLHTEDFSKETSPISKRSGSPILSCPKAKKRKVFKIPQTINKSYVPNNLKTTQPTNVYVFDENYKRNKKYTLKDIKEMESINSNKNIDPYILNFNFDTLLDFEFGGKRNDIDSDIWTADKIIKRFTESVKTKIIPEGWIANHLKLIIWKLISYEVYFPNFMKDICTVKNVLHQLKYRYNRELYNVERPASRKILEKDEVASKLMVLCVTGLYYMGGVYLSGVTSENKNIELSLTDGWYCIKACTDRMIDKLIYDGKICVGTKLAICGAELMNCEQGIAPWEDTSTIRLKISGNSTRRAKWDTRLGFHANGAILSHLSAVKPEGGKISRLRVFVTRVYPMLYVEKFEDGSTLTRSERLEHIQQMKHEADRQNQIEKLYDELEKMTDQESQDSDGLGSDKGLETGSQIYRHLKSCKDTSELRVNLTESQTHLLQEHTIKKRDKLIQNLQKKVQDLVKKRGLDVSRNVVPLLKIRVADVHNGCVSKAMITIWRPNECLLDLITEGAWLDLYNVVPTAVRLSEIQISAGRQSIFQPSKLNKGDKFKTHTDKIKRKCYTIKDLQNTTDTDYNEIDTIGLIFLIEQSTNQSQNIYLTDENKNIISINFWGGIKKFGFENILDTGQVVACLNLQKRTGNTKKQIQQYRVTEFTHFTRTCKINFIRKLTEEFSMKLSSLDKNKIIHDCVAIKNNYANLKYGNTENVTPYRINNSDYNISKNKIFIDSPLAGKLDTNLNLSGLDFESTFKQTDTQDISPERLLRKRKVNERIAKLKMYGEPPPLSSIHIINKPNAIKPYKSPLIPKNDISNVASVKNLPENSANSSPVINRTYLKSINPVKLNFVDEDGNTTDPFAEEFDCSPPLSLD